MRTLLALTVFGGGVANSSLAPMLRIADVTPDVPLVAVMMLALRRGPEVGCLAGLVAGLAQDASTGGLIGVQALTKAILGFVIGVIGSRLSVTSPLVQVPGLVVLTLVEGLARFALLQLFRFPAPFAEVMTYHVVPQAIYNGFVGAALVFAMTCAVALRARAG